ncbi:MAG: PEPxxWA-CTERM sorting domain-containing protein [Phenylobacterium sp.]
MKKLLIAVLGAGALALSSQAHAASQMYNFTVFNGAAFTQPVGTVTVTDNGTASMVIDVLLGPKSYFQMTGNGSFHDDLWFDLAGNPAINYNITTPDGPAPGGGDYPTDAQFVGQPFSNNAYGQGFLAGFDYVVQDHDTSATGGNLNYYGPAKHLTFTITNTGGGILSIASLTGHDVNGQTVFLGADLRECNDGPLSGCVTGPVGATKLSTGVPEPATWAMMLTGFGGMGALLRRRRSQAVVAYA